MSAEQYDSQKYTASMFAVRKAMAMLREHFEHVTIEAIYTDSHNVEVTCTQEWTEDDDEEAEKAGS